MKEYLKILVIVATTIIASKSPAQVLWRSAKNIPQHKVIVLNSLLHKEYFQKYSHEQSKWIDFKDRTHSELINTLMVGYGVTSTLEISAELSYTNRVVESGSTRKIDRLFSDLLVKARYSVLPMSSAQNTGINLIAGLTFPNDEKISSSLISDGKIEPVIGGIVSARINQKLSAHLKGYFWKREYNGKAGDDAKILGAFGYKIKDLVQVRAVYVYFHRFKRGTSFWGAVNDPYISRHSLILDLITEPVKHLSIRPRLMIPISGEGGMNAHPIPMLDIWYVF